jgi:hypothetical protein
MNTQQTSITRRQALALAAALTLAVGTAAAAVGGIAHTSRPAAPTASAVVAQPAQSIPAREADD